MTYIKIMLCSVFGTVDKKLHGLIVMMIIDVVTGVITAIRGKSLKTGSGKISSSAGLMGILKKIAMLMGVAFCNEIDRMLGTDVCRTACVALFIFNEATSTVENLALIGVKFPKIVEQSLHVLNDKREDKNEDSRNAD